MYKSLLLLGAVASIFATNQVVAAGNPEKIQKDPQIVVEPDQTDIFAIPLDEDAQEQLEEVYNLEHYKK